MKGQDKIKRGSGFRGVLAYVLDHDTPEYIGGTLPFGSLKQITSEFVALASWRNDIKKPVWHNSLRLPRDEHLDNNTWLDLAEEYMKRLGFDGTAQWIAFKHNKSDGEHIHIIANRVLPNGRIYLGKNENLKSTKVITDLEKKYELTVTKSAALDENKKVIKRKKSKMTTNEAKKMDRTQFLSERIRLQQAIDSALISTPTVVQFVSKLRENNVIPRPNIASTGKMNGFSFKLIDGQLSFSGSKLGSKYTWGRLIQAGLQYDAQTDAPFLASLKEENIKKSQEIRDCITQHHISNAIAVSKVEKKKYLEFIERYYKRFDHQYYCMKTGSLAFTEESDKIICHLNTPEAIEAQTKLAKIKFGNEFKSSGSESFRRESWLQASLHGCLDHGYEPSERDIAELKARLSSKSHMPVLHHKIAALIEDSGSQGEQSASTIRNVIANNKTLISSKQQQLLELFEQSNQLSKTDYRLTDKDQKDIKQMAFINTAPKVLLQTLKQHQKKLASLKKQSNETGWLDLVTHLKTKKSVEKTNQMILTLKKALNTPELKAKREKEIKRIRTQAEQHNQNLRLRQHSNRQKLSEKIENLKKEIGSLELQNTELTSQLEQMRNNPITFNVALSS